MKLYNKLILYSIFIIVIIILYRINIVEPKIPKIKIKNLEFVIAVYEEDISWLNKIPSDLYSHIYIYNKGTPKTYNFPKSTVINISNEGYEANTYLTHITERYNKLADMTIFLPGTAWTKDYKQKKLLFTLDYISKNNESIVAGINNTKMIKAEYNFSLTSYAGFSNTNNKNNNPDTSVQPALIRPYGNWFKHHFPDENHNCLSYNGIVAASRTDIHKRTKAFYSKLLSQLNSKSPEVGHYIERSWGNILSIENCIPIYTFIEITEILGFVIGFRTH
jgi:hypothetical protein